MKASFIIILLILMFSNSYGQDFDLKIKMPPDWISAPKKLLKTVLTDSIKMDQNTRNKQIQNNNQSEYLYNYGAPNIEGTDYRPSIHVLLRPNTATNKKEFDLSINNSIKEFNKIINEMKIIDSARYIELDGKETVYFKFTGIIQYNSGIAKKFRSKWYLVPAGAYLYQISMNDAENYDCEKIFNGVLNSIKFVPINETKKN